MNQIAKFMSRIFGLFALLGFMLSLVAHIAALLGIDVADRFPYVWSLHIGIFAVFIPFVFSMHKTLGAKPKFADIKSNFPGWIVAIGLVIFIYAILNFILFVHNTEGGSPSIQDGRYVLSSHGKMIRELTEAEYHAFNANVVRGFSGHWMIFYFVPFAYFMFFKKFNTSLDPSVSTKAISSH
jgi:hypothetical protein